MGIGVSLLLIAAGAILVWAVDATVSGVSLDAVGWILLAVGALGLVLSMIFWSSWGGVHPRIARKSSSTAANALALPSGTRGALLVRPREPHPQSR